MSSMAVFFAIVMTVVMAVAWPFFDRKPGDPWFDPARLQPAAPKATDPTLVAAASLALIIAPSLWLAATAASADPLPATFDLPAVPGWQRTSEPLAYPWRPRFDGADRLVMARYRNARGQVVDLAVAAFDRQDEGRELIGFGQGVADPDSEWVWSSPAPAPADARGEQVTAPGPVVRHAVSFYRVGSGVPTGSKAAIKLETMTARLMARDPRAVAIIVSAEQREGRPADAAIAAFLTDLGDVRILADRAVGIR